MSHLIDRLLLVPPALALALVFIVPAAEASIFAGFLFPGEVVVLLGGVLANEQRLSLWAVILAGSLGAIIGDSIGYEVGRHFGERLLARLPRRLVKPEQVVRGRELLRTKGGRAVFIGRFTVALRVLVPGLAGTSRLPYRRFLLFNILGGVLWVAETAVVGYLVGKSYKAAEHQLSLISLGLFAAIIAVFGYHRARNSARLRAWSRRHLGWLYHLGHPVIVSVGALVISMWGAAGLTQDVTEQEGLVHSDPRLLHDIVVQRRSWLTPAAKLITLLGTGPVVYALLVLLGLLLWRRTREWWPLPLALAGLAVGQLLRLAISVLVGRARPDPSLWLAHPSGYAFPSGHTTTATIGYGLIAVLAIRLVPAATRATVAAAAALAVVVGLSRVYLGVHWPTDVIGGWLYGAAWLSLLATITTATRRPRPRPQEPAPAGLPVS